VKGAGFSAQLRLLAAPGGFQAAAWLVLRRLVGLDRYAWLTVPLAGVGAFGSAAHAARAQAVSWPAVAGRWLVLKSPQEWHGLSTPVQQQLDDGSGWGVLPLLSAGARLYACVLGDEVQCQVTIDVRRGRVNTPCELVIVLDEGDCFLSFLVTAPAWRRHGLAAAVVDRAMRELGGEGYRHCHCHVQASNVRSLGTFDKAGWARTGWLVVSRSRQLLGHRVPQGVQLETLPAP
jgi:ribosomal protein S18 acetylase RimI-like enzyme